MFRRWLRRLALTVLSLAVVGFVVYRILLIPRVYFATALMLVQRNALTRDKVDWPSVRTEAEPLMRGARSSRDTYEAIRLVLRRLGDNHSRLVAPEVVRAARAGSNLTLGLTAIWPERVIAMVSKDSPAEAAGVNVGDVIEEVDGKPPAYVARVVLLPRERRSVSLLLRRPGRSEPMPVQLEARVTPFDRPAVVRRLDDRLASIEIPGVLGSGGSFDLDAVAAIREADATPVCGWVVDLRRNVGGNMWPMLHALRPILGEGNPFGYVYGKGPGAKRDLYALKRADPAIAVLTSRLTVSSGELVAVAFRGPASTRSIGESTSGLSTSNMDFPMADGARLVVTTGRAFDRTGRVYDGPIEPDERVDIDWTRIGSDDDPVLRRAADWLREQPQCAALAPATQPR